MEAPNRNFDAAPTDVRRFEIAIDGTCVVLADDPYCDRLRCDHPAEISGVVLADALKREAVERDLGRVVVFAREDVAAGLLDSGFEREGVMPGFYRGQEDCVVVGAYPEAARGRLAEPERVETVRTIVDERASEPPRADGTGVLTRRADPEDAEALAELIGETFAQYPTPSDDPAYVRAAIDEGTPFRLVEDDDGEIVACASADLVRDARTAELTDCATRPSHRGRGLMRAILSDLMDDLRRAGYPTAFTLARAHIVGINLAFARLGFELRGTMPRSCRIGEDVEDMNIWSRRLEPVRRRTPAAQLSASL